MCGRYALFTKPQKLSAMFGLDRAPDFTPRYNAAPMQSLPIIIRNRLGFARWGFTPQWGDVNDAAMAVKMINARSETVHEKPSFQQSWAKGRRCLVPANGFYEWQTGVKNGPHKAKKPYFIRHNSENFFAMAGLWSKIGDVVTFTVLTKAAPETLKDIHARVPVMIAPALAQSWFDASLVEAQNIIASADMKGFKAYPVGDAVGAVANDYEALMDEMTPARADLFG